MIDWFMSLSPVIHIGLGSLVTLVFVFLIGVIEYLKTSGIFEDADG